MSNNSVANALTTLRIRIIVVRIIWVHFSCFVVFVFLIVR